MKIKGVNTPECGKYHGKSSEFLSEFTISLSRLIATCPYSDYHEQSFPDYHGKFVDFVGNSIFVTFLEKNKIDNGCLENLINSSLRKLKTISETRNSPSYIEKNNAIISQIADLISISGLIFILSKFYERPEIWATIKSLWDSHLESNLKDNLVTLQTIISLNPRGGTDFRYTRLLREFLRKHNSNENIESPHIKAFIKNDLSGPDGVDVFIDIYLLERASKISSQKFKFSHKQGWFAKEVERVEMKND